MQGLPIFAFALATSTWAHPSPSPSFAFAFDLIAPWIVHPACLPESPRNFLSFSVAFLRILTHSLPTSRRSGPFQTYAKPKKRSLYPRHPCPGRPRNPHPRLLLCRAFDRGCPLKLAFVSLFRSGGYGRNGRYVYGTAWRSDKTRQGLRAMEGAEVAPVNGIPMRAKETVLASMLRAGIYPPEETAAAESPSQYVRYRRQRLRASMMDKPLQSVIRKAKDVMPKGTLLGIEVEHYPAAGNPFLASLSDRTGRSLTDCVHDGSLRPGGMEIRRLTWAGANGRLNGILGLPPILAGGKVDTRCGLHVHVDVRHLHVPGMGKPEDAACDAGETYDRLCKLYPILKRLVPPSRLRSTYCRWRNNRPESEDFSRSRDGNRYAALNWDSYAEHGTIEWRMQGGSCNPVKIESWALLCQFLTRWASVRDNSIPRNWDQFIAILPQWLASWCILRRERLYGDLGPCSERVLSAVDGGANEGEGA